MRIACAILIILTLLSASVRADDLWLTSPLREWEKVDDAGFGDEGLHGGHLGIDLVAPFGTPVFAAADGQVVRAECASMEFANHLGKPDVPEGRGRYFGTNIVIYHSTHQLYTLYGHLAAIAVREGETVKQGELIGFSGNTGSSSGPHLHFAVANQEQFWGYSQENFPTTATYEYEGVLYYNPENMIDFVTPE